MCCKFVDKALIAPWGEKIVQFHTRTNHAEVSLYFGYWARFGDMVQLRLMANNRNRDEFSEKTKLQIAKRAGFLCSHPLCRKITVGATSDGDSEINIGTAAHICAAAAGGPRYDPDMTRDERRSAMNGIWLCRDHGTAIDSKDPKFTVELLREWKMHAQEDSWCRVMHNEVPHRPIDVSETELGVRLRAAAASDLEVFRRTSKWPSTSVALTLKIQGIGESATTNALANAVTSLDDLILVAPPGMGKTTTVFQIAEGILAIEGGTPLVVPLGDWATEDVSLLDSILRRPAFRGISEDDFRVVATMPGIVLLLDGWNELDSGARRRATVQVATLKAEMPELGLVVSTRKQALDVPFGGTRVDLLPLNEVQQMEIATTMRGDAGARIVDQAWRTEGVRELISIPLYLTALLALPEGVPFPTTKEEVLRRFVTAHEENALRTEMLVEVAQGFQQEFLEGLAVVATSTANTAITDSSARKSISDTEAMLVASGQITIKPQPNSVINVLVSHHVLMHAGDTPGYSFQHQQFQEWYASYFVERLMLETVGNAASCDRLKAEILNQRPWEEAILFAVERLARGEQTQQQACGAAILAAFEVDPILAAEIIFRSTDAVWEAVSTEILGLVGKWHTPSKVDRALSFMITSGRPEFLDLIWPLVSHEQNQERLFALRAGKRFRTSLLGADAAKRIAGLPQQVRESVLDEIVMNSGMDGLDLATAIVKNDSDPEVKASVVNALAFRRADRHVVEVLSTADDKTYDLVAEKGHIDYIPDDFVRKGLEAAGERQRKGGVSHYERLRIIANAQYNEGLSAEVTAIVSQMEIDRKHDSDTHLLYIVRELYPHALAEGLLNRVRENRTLFYGADDVLASANLALEDGALVEIALAETRSHDDRAEAAASVLGPLAVGRMLEVYFEAKKQVRDANGKYDKTKSDRYRDLRTRIGHTPGSSLIAAVQARAADADNEEISELAELLSRRSESEDNRARPFSEDVLATIGVLTQDWGERMLTSGDAASRWQVASLATLISCAPSVSLLPLLKRLLDDNLRRYRAFREQAKAGGWRPSEAVNEARSPHTHEYMRAFLAIKAPETAAMMKEYLADEHFGQLAATVLAQQWMEVNEPKDVKNLWRRFDFSRVEERQAARAAHPAETSAEAEAIFRVIDLLIADGSTEDQKNLAVALGIVAARLPHGQREATIEKLISFASRGARAALLLNLILSGENIDIKVVAAGISEVLEAAEKETWILEQGDAYQLKEWLRLLPLADHPAATLSIVRGLPDAQRNPSLLEEMVGAFGDAPSNEAEEVLFKLAEEDSRFYANRCWRDTVLRRGTVSAARRFIDLTAQCVIGEQQTDGWYLARQIGGLIGEDPELRTHTYDLLKNGLTSPGLMLLAQAVAENPDTEGLLLLIDFEIEQKRSLVGPRTIESVVTENVPSENWKGAYDIIPVPAVELRKRLLEKTTSGEADDPAARCLNLIDKIRDNYGAPESEPRHPDLNSGKPWPIMTLDPDADAAD
ncbi:MAG: hypothetical protein WD005_03330 [Haliea sp.]